MKLWLKGGLWGAVIGLVLWTLPMVMSIAIGEHLIKTIFAMGDYVTNIFWSLTSPWCAFETGGEERAFCWLFVGHISNVILFFILGSIAGLIIQIRNPVQMPKKA